MIYYYLNDDPQIAVNIVASGTNNSTRIGQLIDNIVASGGGYLYFQDTIYFNRTIQFPLPWGTGINANTSPVNFGIQGNAINSHLIYNGPPNTFAISISGVRQGGNYTKHLARQTLNGFILKSESNYFSNNGIRITGNGSYIDIHNVQVGSFMTGVVINNCDNLYTNNFKVRYNYCIGTVWNNCHNIELFHGYSRNTNNGILQGGLTSIGPGGTGALLINCSQFDGFYDIEQTNSWGGYFDRVKYLNLLSWYESNVKGHEISPLDGDTYELDQSKARKSHNNIIWGDVRKDGRNIAMDEDPISRYGTAYTHSHRTRRLNRDHSQWGERLAPPGTIQLRPTTPFTATGRSLFSVTDINATAGHAKITIPAGSGQHFNSTTNLDYLPLDGQNTEPDLYVFESGDMIVHKYNLSGDLPTMNWMRQIGTSGYVNLDLRTTTPGSFYQWGSTPFWTRFGVTNQFITSTPWINTATLSGNHNFYIMAWNLGWNNQPINNTNPTLNFWHFDPVFNYIPDRGEIYPLDYTDLIFELSQTTPPNESPRTYFSGKGIDWRRDQTMPINNNDAVLQGINGNGYESPRPRNGIVYTIGKVVVSNSTQSLFTNVKTENKAPSDNTHRYVALNSGLTGQDQIVKLTYYDGQAGRSDTL